MKLYVLTSDQYLRCIPPFMHLFNRFWGKAQEVIFVGFKHPTTPLPRNARFWSVGKQEEYTWSQQVLRLLDINTDPVFALLLEDYFLDAPVNKGAVYSLYNYMMDVRRVVKIDLTDDRLKVAHEPYPAILDIEMVRSTEGSAFQTSLQAALWNADFLRYCLKEEETPWEFEKKGTKRLILARNTGRFAGDILGCTLPPVRYINAVGGEGTHPQDWATKRFPGWMLKELQLNRLME